ncbi:MAG: aspartate aminotransferase family protein [Anaerolineae bacterium]|nr:aspartate aminotransferase family protein [Anaerolineae bacterium]
MSEPMHFSEFDYYSRDNLKHMVLDFVQMHDFMQQPLVYDRGEGIYVWDAKGDKYLDGISGVWVMSLGHSNERIKQAMREQLDRLVFASPILSTNTRAMELVEMIGKRMPQGLTTVKLLSGGSEATETAIKLARQYYQNIGKPHKKKIISRYNNFHGVTLGALTATGMANRKAPFEPLTGGFLHIPPPGELRSPYPVAPADRDKLAAQMLETVIQYEGADNIAAFIAEPIQLSTGNVVPSDDYWPLIRQICDRYDVMLILDEIATGVGRTGKMWAADHWGIAPDIMCAGKGLSAGYSPLSAVGFSDKVADAFISQDREKAFADGHTYGGNPLTCAAGIAALQELDERNLIPQVAEMGEYLMTKLQDLRELGVIGDIRGKGLMIGVEFVKDPETLESFPKETEFGLRVGRNTIHQKKMLIRSAPNWVAVAPPFITTCAEIDDMVGRLGEAIFEELGKLKQ